MTRDRLPDIVFLVAVAFATAVMLWLECGCAARPEAREPVQAVTPWCVAMQLSFDGKQESGVACASTLAVCQNVQARAIRFGSMAKITQVGACRRRGE